jgi:hypothetical protein
MSSTKADSISLTSGRRSVAEFANEACNLYRGKVIRKNIYPCFYGAARGEKMDLRCPSCNGTDLKKLSLAYQQGRVQVDTRTRLRGVVVGEGGPNVVVGRATTRGIQETEQSKLLSPPTKWSYLKLVLWSAFVSLVALVVYVRSVMSSPPPASTLPVKLYAVLAPVAFLFLVALYWRHNQSTYQSQYAQWNRSFICERCGTVSQHDLPSATLS